MKALGCLLGARTLKHRDQWRVPGIGFQPLGEDLIHLVRPGKERKDHSHLPHAKVEVK